MHPDGLECDRNCRTYNLLRKHWSCLHYGQSAMLLYHAAPAACGVYRLPALTLQVEHDEIKKRLPLRLKTQSSMLCHTTLLNPCVYLVYRVQKYSAMNKR